MVKPTPDKTGVQVEIPAQPRKEPRQARSIALVTAVKQTGRQILESEGREALNAMRLAEDSGVAISSIYEYFPTMEALIAAIFDDYRTEARIELYADIMALPPEATLLDGILLALRAVLAAHVKKTLFDPVFSVRSTHYDELVRLDVVKAKQLWTATASSALMQRFASEIRVKDREKAEFLVYQTWSALPRAMLLERPCYLTDEDTPKLIARMLHAMLTDPT
ncbi:TetR/AcrR family transcriptional regulator [Pseudomonas sp. R5(2019)]|uniref:TetR/AcrR family transcriptional regulator n=1 Tax=Pseudomonas sp. R5(2019) TaxID=2697566 RepID=UPI0014129134|nr:TetR/AcrR family transcriptional regulator [Pseudomonas sp. R5(2019)]NBA96878.1 TetR family transcriptional regulator [Pseudomonas sp. R5(2019)]